MNILTPFDVAWCNEADGRLVDEDATDNQEAKKYVIRSAGRENLEASDAFFAEFVQEIHRRGMKIILDGVFNHCGSFNKWLDAEEVYKQSGDYEPGPMNPRTALTTAFSIFMTRGTRHGRATQPMTAGGA